MSSKKTPSAVLFVLFVFLSTTLYPAHAQVDTTNYKVLGNGLEDAVEEQIPSRSSCGHVWWQGIHSMQLHGSRGSSYHPNTDCMIHIDPQTPENSLLNVTLAWYDIEPADQLGRCSDWVQLFLDDESMTEASVPICGSGRDRNFILEHNKFIIRFITDRTATVGKGFELTYTTMVDVNELRRRGRGLGSDGLREYGVSGAEEQRSPGPWTLGAALLILLTSLHSN